MTTRLIIAFIAGCLAPLALSPFDIWPIGILSLALLAWLLQSQATGKVFWLALVYGLGYFGIGVSWVYVSIHNYGAASPILASLLTGVFIVGLSLVFTFSFCLYSRLIGNYRYWPLGFALCWAWGEWLRSWLMTGFPWLNVGYAHIDSPLGGWAPVIGIIGLGFLVALSSALLLSLARKQLAPLALAAIVIIWGAGFQLHSVLWTSPDGPAIKVAVVQPNVDQDKKWLTSFIQPTLERFERLTSPLWEKVDWVIWPEAAIPILSSSAQDILQAIDKRAKESNTAFFTGLLSDEIIDNKLTVYNSLIGLGDASGTYYKQQLVPFGEYVPFEQYLRGLIGFFDLPTSRVSKGPGEQPPIRGQDYTVGASICYEIAYGDLIASYAIDTNVLITISNDAWFGQSIGPIQHFQMARMRALETGRYLIRSTNTGISAIVSPKGQVLAQAESFIETSLTGEVIPMKDNTPYMRWQSQPTVILLLILTGLMGARQRLADFSRDQNRG